MAIFNVGERVMIHCKIVHDVKLIISTHSDYVYDITYSLSQPSMYEQTQHMKRVSIT